MKKYRLFGTLTIGILSFIFVLNGCGKADVGLTGGRFAPCPDSPNCVSSMTDDQKHFIEPIAYEGSREEARQVMLSVIQSMKRSRVISESEAYIHAEFRSLIFRFVDDVEFYFPEDVSIIHLKSASRTGYSDFGVNRRRLEDIRDRFNEQSKKASILKRYGQSRNRSLF